MATASELLDQIADIIETVDNRCMAADGPVTPTLNEMTQAEISKIYTLAKHAERSPEPTGKTDTVPAGPTNIYSMDIHQTAQVSLGPGESLNILRVYGGWLYERWKIDYKYNLDTGERVAEYWQLNSTVYVPWPDAPELSGIRVEVTYP